MKLLAFLFAAPLLVLTLYGCSADSTSTNGQPPVPVGAPSGVIVSAVNANIARVQWTRASNDTFADTIVVEPVMLGTLVVPYPIEDMHLEELRPGTTYSISVRSAGGSAPVVYWKN